MLWQNTCVDCILTMFVWCLLQNHSVSPPPFLPQEELHPGCKVRLKALHVQRNGQLGVVEDYVAPRQRWRVRLVASGKCHDFKALLETSWNEIPQTGWPKIDSERTMYLTKQLKEKETSDECHTWCWHCCLTAGIGPLFYKSNDHKTKGLRTASHCHCVNRKTAKKNKVLDCPCNVWLATFVFLKYQHTFGPAEGWESSTGRSCRSPPSVGLGGTSANRKSTSAGRRVGQIWSGFVDCMLECKGYWDVLSN